MSASAKECEEILHAAEKSKEQTISQIVILFPPYLNMMTVLFV